MSSGTTTTVNRGGIGFVGALTLLFIALKLLGITAVASWSWWWVLAPLWISFGLWIAFILIGIVVILIAAALGK